MLEDYIINDQIRYENHYLKVAQTDIEIGGVTGAALLSALIVDTEEGARRGIAIDTQMEQMAWIAKYEREVRRDEWGLIGTEVELLHNAHIELATSEVRWADICPNVRLLDLALHLVMTYMQYLSVETFKNHIWECCSWKAPFAQWLMSAAQEEKRRQQFLRMDWTDPVQVNELYEDLQRETNELVFIFEGEDAEDIYKRYFTWLWSVYQAQVREIPGERPRSVKHRNFVVEQETDWTFMAEEIKGLDDAQQQLWAQWMINWQKYITKHLKPEKPVLFWEKEVSEEQQKQLEAPLVHQGLRCGIIPGVHRIPRFFRLFGAVLVIAQHHKGHHRLTILTLGHQLQRAGILLVPNDIPGLLRAVSVPSQQVERCACLFILTVDQQIPGRPVLLFEDDDLGDPQR